MSTVVLSNPIIASRAYYTLGIPDVTPLVPTLRLYVNNHTPLCTDSLADFTTASWGDYSDITLDFDNWVFDQTDCILTGQYGPYTVDWSNGGETIYGHVVYDYTSGDWTWAELWDTPFALPSTGGALTYTLFWTDRQCATMLGAAGGDLASMAQQAVKVRPAKRGDRRGGQADRGRLPPRPGAVPGSPAPRPRD